MNYIKLALISMKRDWKIRSISIIQITISVVVINLFLSSIFRAFDIAWVSRKFCNENIYVAKINALAAYKIYFSPDNSSEIDMLALAEEYEKETGVSSEAAYFNSDIYDERYSSYDYNIRWMGEHLWDDNTNKETYGRFNKIKEILSDFGIEKVYTSEWIFSKPLDDEFQISSINIWDSEIVNNLDIEMYKGHWLSEANPDEKYINGVAYATNHTVDNLKIGDIVSAEVYNFKQKQYERLDIKIIGILKSPTYSLNGGGFSTSNSGNSIDDIFARTAQEPSSESKRFSITIYPFEGYSYEDYHATVNENVFFETSENDSIEEITARLTDNGYNVGNLYELHTKYSNEIFSELRQSIIFLSVTFVASVLSMIGVTALVVEQGTKKYAIYSLCGAMIIDNVCIIAIQMMIMLMTSGFFCFISLFIWNEMNVVRTDDLFGITFGMYNVFATLILFLFLFIVSLVIPIRLLSVNLPAELWRKI